MSKRTAVIVGATGSIGRELVPLVTSSPHYNRLIVFHYRPTSLAGRPKIEERIVDFSKLAAVPPLGAGTVFCCIGTTQKKAGSTEAFQKVDRDIPVELAKWAAASGVAAFVTISSSARMLTPRASICAPRARWRRVWPGQGCLRRIY